MPRTHDAHWVGFQATGEEKAVLDNYCKEMQQSKTQVLRSLINTLSYPAGERDHWLLKLELGASHSRVVAQYCEKYGFTPSDAVRHAIFMLGAQEVMSLSEADAKIFIDAINNPPEPSEQLKELMKSKASQKPFAITKESEIKPWLESVMSQADKEIELAEQLRTNAAQLQSIATQMFAAAECLERR